MPRESNARSPSLTSQDSNSSAVIIADLIADVPVTNRCSPIKEETTLEKKSDESNGSNLSKGVVLNALQFGQNEPKLVSTPPTIVAKPFTDEFKEMSLIRKVAFGLSFLPSLMFVLCFSVIFPCEIIQPCINMDWQLNLNNTEVISNLLVPQNLLFTFATNRGFGIRSIKESSGSKLWENDLASPPKFLKCANLDYTDKQSCLIIDDSGTVHLFDPIDGRKSTESKLNRSISSVTILPDCDGDGLDEIAVATSDLEIRILSIRNILIADCDTTPSLLMSWRKEKGADLVLVCKKGQNEILARVSQEEWCKKSSHTAKMSILRSEKAGILSQSAFLSTTDGFVLWTLDFVTMFASDGHHLWSVPSYNHSSKNRFLLHGNFRTDEKEVIILSSDISSNLQITRFNAENGKTKQTETKPHLEISEAIIINGAESDFILGLKKKLRESLPSQAVSRINEMSASVINILTNKATTALPSSSKVIEEISLMELDLKDVKTIHTEELLTGESYESKFTVVLKENKEKNKLLQLFVQRNPEDNRTEFSTTIKSIKISNWDTSSEKTSLCMMK